MVMTSKVQLSAVAMLALSAGACTPGDGVAEFERTAADNRSAQLTANVDPRISAAQSSLALASAALDNEDPDEAFAELLTAADIAGALSPADEGYCGLGIQASQIAYDMVEQGAYGEARMGYAIAIHFTQGCEATLPAELQGDSLRLRQHDARTIHEWALASAEAAAPADFDEPG